MCFLPRRRPCALAAALALALTFPAPWAHAQVNLPALGEAASDDLGVAEERRYGQEIMRAVWRDPAYLDDPLLLLHVQSLWDPLVAAARQGGQIGADIETAFAWQTFLVRDASVNAFALPGGHVGVHLGLIAITRTRDELASVLAHELTHVSQRHIARSVGASQRTGMATMAAMLLALVAANRSGNNDAAAAAISGGQAALIQGQLNYSRDAEREADRIGYLVFEQAGYADGGMAAMFERLEQANRINDTSSFPYLRSHPLTGARISEARLRVREAGRSDSGDEAERWRHALMRARAQVLMDTGVPALQRSLAEPLATIAAHDRLAARYAAALAASLLDEHGRALELAELAERAAAGAPAALALLRLLRAEILERAGQPAAALQLLALDAGLPGPRPVMLAQAEAAWSLARLNPAAAKAPLRQAVEALQTWTAEHREDSLAWARLGQVAEAAGLPLRAARAQAEVYAAKGQWQLAVDRLRAAQRQAEALPATSPEAIERQVIDARLRTLWALLRAEREEQLRQQGHSRR